MYTSPTITEISKALLDAQKAIGSAKKDAVNPFFHSHYADLGSVMEACKEALNNAEITVLQPVEGMNVETVLLHSSGEWIQGSTPIVCAKQNDPQSMGSAITYARRYGLQSMVFIPAEDDDGEGAMSRTTKQNPTPFVPASSLTAMCPIHKIKMVSKMGQYGEFWSHLLEDGKWCNGKQR